MEEPERRSVKLSDCQCIELYARFVWGKEVYRGEISYGHHGCKTEESVFGREEIGWEISFKSDGDLDGFAHQTDNKSGYNPWRQIMPYNGENHSYWKVVVAKGPKGYYVLGLEGWTTSDGWVVYYVPGKKMKDRAYNTCWTVEDLLDSAGLLDRDRYIQDC